MARIIWEHYGNNAFDPEKIKANAKRIFANKPNGLWGSPSPKGRKYWTWKQWCKGEGYHIDRLEKSFKFRISNKAKLLWIHKMEDALKYMDIEPFYPGSDYFRYTLNVNKVMSEFDGMVLIHGDHYCELHDNGFSTWDVDSICVWNPDVVEVI